MLTVVLNRTFGLLDVCLKTDLRKKSEFICNLLEHFSKMDQQLLKVILNYTVWQRHFTLLTLFSFHCSWNWKNYIINFLYCFSWWFVLFWLASVMYSCIWWIDSLLFHGSLFWYKRKHRCATEIMCCVLFILLASSVKVHASRESFLPFRWYFQADPSQLCSEHFGITAALVKFRSFVVFAFK